MSASSWVYLDVERITRETDKALCLQVDGEEVWIPLTQIHDADSLKAGDEDVTVAVTEWIAEQKGLT